MLNEVTTEYQRRFIDIQLPARKLLIARGDSSVKSFVSDVIESILGTDYTRANAEEIFQTDSSLTFDDGEAYIKARAVCIKGKSQNVHCILDNGVGVKSFLTAEGTKDTPISYDFTHYNNGIEANKWVRLVALTNNVLGYKAVSLLHDEIIFDLKNDFMKLIFLLLSESIATPEGYSHIILLSESIQSIEGYDANLYAKLLASLCNIGKLDKVISFNEVDVSYFPKGFVFSYIDI